MKNKDFKKLASEWFEKGNHDLEDARRLFNAGGYPDTICFHCHQAAEKYLKGFLVLNNKKFRRIHDLVIFLEDCSKINKEFKEVLDECKKLNKYYIESRYPIETPVSYSETETKEALEKAEKIVSFITTKITG
jgi:HEPN domain-containing protein